MYPMTGPPRSVVMSSTTVTYVMPLRTAARCRIMADRAVGTHFTVQSSFGCTISLQSHLISILGTHGRILAAKHITLTMTSTATSAVADRATSYHRVPVARDGRPALAPLCVRNTCARAGDRGRRRVGSRAGITAA